MFSLDEKSLDYIESRRHKTRNADVVLYIILKSTVLKSQIRLGHYRTIAKSDGDIVVSCHDNPDRSNDNLNILVDEKDNGQKTLLSYKITEEKTKYTIKASDWINDYQEFLGIGKFLIVEVPQPKIDDTITATLTDDQRIFKERLDAAHNTLQEMESELRNGEWGNVVAKLRDIELFKKERVTKFIRRMISQSTTMEL
jgi:hypothetical protein